MLANERTLEVALEGVRLGRAVDAREASIDEFLENKVVLAFVSIEMVLKLWNKLAQFRVSGKEASTLPED